MKCMYFTWLFLRHCTPSVKTAENDAKKAINQNSEVAAQPANQ